MEIGLIPFQKENVNDFIFRFQFGIEVRLHFYGIGKTVRNATDNKMKDFQELFECYYSEARVEVWDIATNKNLTERFLGEYTGVCSVEALVELFVKILCFSDRRRKG